MVLQQDSPQSPTQDLGYILKNFKYHEIIRFNGDADSVIAIHGNALNRGGSYAQNPFVLFYEQQVRFSEGPQKGEVIHLENGAWLHLETQHQPIGPYDGQGDEPGEPVPQPADMTMAKQMNIPHGVSLLALGSFSVNEGEPVIADGPNVQPPGIDPAPYEQQLDDLDNFQNPHPDLTNNVHLPLQQAVCDLAAAGNPVTNYIHCEVSTDPYGGVLNIPFEARKARLDSYLAEYWLLSIDGGKNYDILAYTQTIILDIAVRGTLTKFPRPTTNIVCRLT